MVNRTVLLWQAEMSLKLEKYFNQAFRTWLSSYVQAFWPMTRSQVHFVFFLTSAWSLTLYQWSNRLQLHRSRLICFPLTVYPPSSLIVAHVLTCVTMYLEGEMWHPVMNWHDQGLKGERWVDNWKFQEVKDNVKLSRGFNFSKETIRILNNIHALHYVISAPILANLFSKPLITKSWSHYVKIPLSPISDYCVTRHPNFHLFLKVGSSLLHLPSVGIILQHPRLSYF